jgi:hypothetical protein
MLGRVAKALQPDYDGGELVSGEGPVAVVVGM